MNSMKISASRDPSISSTINSFAYRLAFFEKPPVETAYPRFAILLCTSAMGFVRHITSLSQGINHHLNDFQNLHHNLPMLLLQQLYRRDIVQSHLQLMLRILIVFGE